MSLLQIINIKNIMIYSILKNSKNKYTKIIATTSASASGSMVIFLVICSGVSTIDITLTDTLVNNAIQGLNDSFNNIYEFLQSNNNIEIPKFKETFDISKPTFLDNLGKIDTPNLINNSLDSKYTPHFNYIPPKLHWYNTPFYILGSFIYLYPNLDIYNYVAPILNNDYIVPAINTNFTVFSSFGNELENLSDNNIQENSTDNQQQEPIIQTVTEDDLRGTFLADRVTRTENVAPDGDTTVTIEIDLTNLTVEQLNTMANYDLGSFAYERFQLTLHFVLNQESMFNTNASIAQFYIGNIPWYYEDLIDSYVHDLENAMEDLNQYLSEHPGSERTLPVRNMQYTIYSYHTIIRLIMSMAQRHTTNFTPVPLDLPFSDS